MCEKPSVGVEFAKALHVYDRKDGYIEGNGYIVTWAIGHLVALSYPEVYDSKYKNWNLDDLPFIPDKYRYEVIKDVKNQFNIVEKLLNRSDVELIYNAGDSGREGEYIQRLIYMMAKVHKPIYRVWIDSQTEEEIRKGIRLAKPSAEYDSIAEAADMRAKEDYLIGINFSRALSLKFGYEFKQKAQLDAYRPIAVGRVMSCVLGMIVEREREIRNFVSQDFYKIDARTNGLSLHWKAVEGTKFVNSPLLFNDTGFKDRTNAEKLQNALNTDKRLKIINLEKKLEKKGAPLLYNLAELQAECTRLFKISPDETLSIAQKLYESKLTTYPRTDARVLSSAVCKEIDVNISGLANGEVLPDVAKTILGDVHHRNIGNTRYCDDSKITDHYAIIPTGENDISGLSELERNVYTVIVKRFLAIFMAQAEYAKTAIEFIHRTGEHFVFSERVLIKSGYRKLYLGQNGEETPNPFIVALQNGMVIPIESFDIVEGKTNPPKRYTSGSMILAMENAGNLIEDEELRETIKGSGIGTSATRAAVIEKLVSKRNQYVALEKKTQILKPTLAGEVIYDILASVLPSILSPKMTANWEKGLQQIERKEISKDKFYGVLTNYVRKNMMAIMAVKSPEMPKIERTVAGKCPICGADLYKSEKGYYCSKRKKSDKKSCQFAFTIKIKENVLPEAQVNKLLQGQSTDYMTMRGPKGEYSMRIKVHENGKCSFEMPHEETNMICEKCNNKLIKTKYAYECSYCGTQLTHTFFGRELSLMELTEFGLLKVIGPLEFHKKDGMSYKAFLINRRGKVALMKETIGGRTFTRSDAEIIAEKGKIEKCDFGTYCADIGIKNGFVLPIIKKNKKRID